MSDALDKFLAEAFPPSKKAGSGKPPAVGAGPKAAPAAGPKKPPFNGPSPNFSPVKLGTAKGTDDDPMAPGDGQDPNAAGGDNAEVFQMMQQAQQERERQEAEARKAREEAEQAEREKVKRMRAAADAEVSDALDDQFNDHDDQVVFYPSIDQLGMTTDGTESFATTLDKKMGLDDEEDEENDKGEDQTDKDVTGNNGKMPDDDEMSDDQGPLSAKDKPAVSPKDDKSSDVSAKDDTDEPKDTEDVSDLDDNDAEDDGTPAPLEQPFGRRVMPKVKSDDDEENDDLTIHPDEEEEDGASKETSADSKDTEDDTSPTGKSTKSAKSDALDGDESDESSDDEDAEDDEESESDGSYPSKDAVKDNIHDGIFPPKPEKDDVDRVALAAQGLDGEDELDPDAKPDELDKELDQFGDDDKKDKDSEMSDESDDDEGSLPKKVKASKLKLKVNQDDLKIKKV